MKSDVTRKSTSPAAQAPQPQVVFQLDAEAVAAFEQILDRPPEPSARVRRLLKTPATWES